jgi:CheY-like chemotaxis protein
MKSPVTILSIGQIEESIFLKKEEVNHRDETCEIIGLRDGETAISYLDNAAACGNTKKPYLIVIDFHLQGITGMELLQHIKKSFKLKSIPVIMVSRTLSKEDVLNCYLNRANCVLTCSLNFKNNSILFRAIKDFWINIVQLPTFKD